MILEDRGTHFDPAIVDAFIARSPASSTWPGSLEIRSTRNSGMAVVVHSSFRLSYQGSQKRTRKELIFITPFGIMYEWIVSAMF